MGDLEPKAKSNLDFTNKDLDAEPVTTRVNGRGAIFMIFGKNSHFNITWIKFRSLYSHFKELSVKTSMHLDKFKLLSSLSPPHLLVRLKISLKHAYLG